MAWWGWLVLWVTLSVGALLMFALSGLSLWRKAMALLGELNVASERFAAVSEGLNALAARAGAAQDLAVFADPVDLRRKRAAEHRAAARRKARRR